MSTPRNTPNFDLVARPYRWLEYATLGPFLERTRNRHLPRLLTSKRALILGDGDGRFTARLLAANLTLQAHAVDLSARMLHLLSVEAGPHARRLTTARQDARTLGVPPGTDLVVTHFFLDCLTQPEADELIHRVAHALPPGALWAVSEFRIPAGLLHWPAKLYVRALYLAFRILTGLRVTALPDFAEPLRKAGFACQQEHLALFGVLTSEIWQKSVQAPENRP